MVYDRRSLAIFKLQGFPQMVDYISIKQKNMASWGTHPIAWQKMGIINSVI